MKTGILQIVMPMAGLGSRFREQGFAIPKPLIPVDGQPMFLSALASLDRLRASQKLVCVIRRVDDTEYGLGSIIREARPGAEIVTIPATTRGAAESAAAAAAFLRREDPVLIMDCDLRFHSAQFVEILSHLASGAGPDIALLSFPSSDPRFSYAALDPGGDVTGTAEKQVISSHALVGAYAFRRAGAFLDATAQLLVRPLTGSIREYYMSSVIDLLIKGGAQATLTDGEFVSFGTPEELRAYESRPPY